MRIYEGSPRQDWEEVLRCVGAYLDDRGMRGIVFLETDKGFIIQGTSVTGTTGSGESMGRSDRETLELQDEDVGGFMDDALARRGRAPEPTPKHFESQLRVIGRYLDGLHPRDIFFFELEGAYVIRITQAGQGGLKQELIEFTQADIADLMAGGPGLRRTDAKAKPA
ncbi:MAG TPA: hypothetical protein VGM49_03390 [Candidatus Limnocylindrales bacterium]|jgi:hypothetical protein